MIKEVVTYSDAISSLHPTADGLWLGHHGGVSFLDPRTGAFAKWTTAHGLPAHPVLHIASHADRLALATPNGVAWSDQVRDLVQNTLEEEGAPRWERGLMHAKGAGAYVNGVAFVGGKIYATTGGGRIYLEGTDGFQLLELPLRQARLLRVLPLPSGEDTMRLVLITNNSGVLLLATGGGQEASLYQWGEDEGLYSRYVTSVAHVGKYVVIGVHGCIHVASQLELIDEPENISRWGRVVLRDLQGPAEHSRIHSLCEHRDSLYAGTSAGLYRVSIAELEIASHDRVAAERVDETPVRHLASWGGELWAVQHFGLGRILEGSISARQPAPDRGADDDASLERGRARPGAPTPLRPRITSYGKRWRFVPEPRWRGFNVEPETRQILSMVSTPDGLVIGGEAGRVVQRVGNRWITETVARPRRPPEIQSIVHDPDSGNLWVATRYGLFQRDHRGRWFRDASFPGRTVHHLCVWNSNMVALGSAGLHVYVQGAWSEILFADDTPPLFTAASSVDALALAGRPGGGFFLWQREQQHPEPLSLPVGRANCMTWCDAGKLWLGTDRGLARWDGEQVLMLAWNAEREDHVGAILVHQGRLYVGSQAGLWCARTDTLREAGGEDLERQGQRLGLLDGLPNPVVTSLVLHDHQLWVGTQGGLAMIDPGDHAH